MSGTNREINELLVDYAGALRDGGIPIFLKSLTHKEARNVASSNEFWDAAEVVRTLNSVGFADKAVTTNVSLFISHVDAKIASRLKKLKASPPGKRSSHARYVTESEDKTEKSI